MFKKIILFFFSIFAFMFPVFLSSCSFNNQIYFANFESYISPDLMEELEGEFKNLKFRFYDTNETLERNFTRNYDIATPSSYIVQKFIDENKIAKIEWDRFNLTYFDENTQQEKKVNNSNDALNLFNEDIQSILKQNFIKTGVDLLDYAVPYFAQDFVLGYKNEKIPEPLGGWTWDHIANYFGDNVGKNKKYNKIVMIDDYRSVYSIPRLIETKNDLQPSVNLGGSPNDIHSIDSFKKTYNNFFGKFKNKNSFLLNSDSNNVLNDFTSEKGSDVGIMYNGDLLFSVLGGDEFPDPEDNPFFNDEDNEENFNVHFIRPNNTLMALDMLVINKNSKHIDDSHEIIKKIALEGSSYGEDITKTVDDEDESYYYGPMKNFDYILYTSPLKKIYDHVVDKDDGYFSYLIDGEKPYSQAFVDFCIEIFDSFKTTSKNMIEKNLSDINKSNMYYAFSDIKERI